MSFTLTGTNPSDVKIPMGGKTSPAKKHLFDILGTGIQVPPKGSKKPSPIISVNDKESYQHYAVGCAYIDSNDQKLRIVHMPASPTGKAGTMSIWGAKLRGWKAYLAGTEECHYLCRKGCHLGVAWHDIRQSWYDYSHQWKRV